jgi:hypothetical protein
LAARVAFDGVRSHSHWTGVHRVILKAGSYFPVSKITPPVGLANHFQLRTQSEMARRLHKDSISRQPAMLFIANTPN